MNKDTLNEVNEYYEKMYGKDVIKAFMKMSLEDFAPKIHYSFLGETYNTNISLESIDDLKLAYGINYGSLEIVRIIDYELSCEAENNPEMKRMLDLYKFRKHST